MFFDKIVGIRKVLMGLCMTGIGITCNHETLLIDVYGLFCIANAIEHLCKIFIQKKITAPPTADLPNLGLAVKKILDCQDTQIKALEFVVGFIKDSQRARPTP